MPISKRFWMRKRKNSKGLERTLSHQLASLKKAIEQDLNSLNATKISGLVALIVTAFLLGFWLNQEFLSQGLFAKEAPDPHAPSGQRASSQSPTWVTDQTPATEQGSILKPGDRQYNPHSGHLTTAVREATPFIEPCRPNHFQDDSDYGADSTETWEANRNTVLNQVYQASDDGDESALPWLTELALTDPNPEIRIEALDSVVEVSMEIPYDTLRAVANDTNEQVYEAALDYLIDYDSEFALHLLRQKLKRAKPGQGLDLMHRISDAGDEAPLSAYIAEQRVIADKHPNHRKRLAALRQLGRVNTPLAQAALRDLEALSEDPFTRRHARKVVREYF